MGRRKFQIGINLTQFGFALGIERDCIVVDLLCITLFYSRLGTGTNVFVDLLGDTIYDSQRN